MKNSNPNILQGNLTKGLITLSAPIIFAMFFHSLLSIVDTFWVGKIGATAVAAISVSWPIIFILIALAAGISTGCSALVARFVGSKDLASASRVAQNSLIIGVVFAVVLTILGLLSISTLFRFLGTSGELHTQAVAYTNIIFYGTTFSILMFILGSVLRGEGDTKTPMKIGVGINILNMILDPILIFGFGWGVQGAAIATVVSTLAGLVAYLSYFWQGKSLVKIVFNKLEYSQKLIYEILFIGIPASLRNITNAIGVFFVLKIITTYGSAVVAAYGIAFRVEMFGVLPVVAIALSTVTMVGQNLGANNLPRAKMSGWISASLGAAIMAIFGILVYVFAKPIIGFFNSEADVIFYGTQALKIKAPVFLFSALVTTLSAAFQAFGKSHYSFFMTVFRVVLMLALAYWFNTIWGVLGVWWAIALSGVVSGLINVSWYKIYQPKPALNNK